MNWTEAQYNDYLKKKNNVHRARTTSALDTQPKSEKRQRDDTALNEAYTTAIQTIYDLQTHCNSFFLGSSPFSLSIKRSAPSAGDYTNIYKGVEDGLQTIAFENDKQNWTDFRDVRGSRTGGNLN